MSKVKTTRRDTLRPPVPLGDLPRRDADQSERLPLADLVEQVCERAGLDKNFVSEIRVTPGTLEIRVQLTRDNGSKYVVSADIPEVPDSQRGRVGELAEEVVAWEIST